VRGSGVTSDQQAGPAAEYARRLSARRALAARLAQLERRISMARLAVFIAGVVVAFVALDRHAISPWWIAVPVACFIALVLLHDRVIKRRQRADRAVTFYERGVARLEHRWAGTGESGERFANPSHPYAADLDLFGRGSLFELLCTARTRAGEETLASWLQKPAPPDVVGARQTALTELRPRLDLREDLALLGTDVRAGLDPDALATWAAAAPVHTRAALRAAAAVLVIALLLTTGGWLTDLTGPLPVAAVLLLELLFALRLRQRVVRVVRTVQRPGRDLRLLAELLARLERERFTAPHLVRLRAALDTGGEPPSARIAHLHRLIHLLDARANQFFAPLAALLLWTTQLALAIDAWHASSGAGVLRWLTTVGEIEALCALASYAYEHPRDPFPEVVEQSPTFDGQGLGHPLIPEERCVRNDVNLGAAVRLLVVSGSNMSGKSTLLRTVGTNTVLALAGAPVRAQRLRLSAVALGASIRISDSLQEGTSRFYAEITRLRQLMDLASGPQPLLFLLDEILHGTNSHDRGIGAAAVVRGFVERGAIGLVTTHDLALAHIAEMFDGHAANVHFEDHLEDGQMMFDYRMRPGVVEKSNAVALMRAVGLEV
jgi:MutS domain V